MKTQNTVALALAGGALLGTVAAMILAPKTGRQARSVLYSRANKLRQRVKRSGDGDVESIEDYADLSAETEGQSRRTPR